MILCSAGKISLDNVFQERERLNHNIVGKRIPPLTKIKIINNNINTFVAGFNRITDSVYAFFHFFVCFHFLGYFFYCVIFLLFAEAINHAAEVWGIRCLRYEIRKFLGALCTFCLSICKLASVSSFPHTFL